MSTLAQALIDQLDDHALDQLAGALAPRIARCIRTEVAVDGWLRGADQIAEYIGAPRSRVYALTSARRLPVERDGSNLIARRSELDAWLRAGGARRP
jgi:excisionase family DNA binding protein